MENAMPYRANYPATVREVLDPTRKYRPGALRAVRALRRAGAWRGSLTRRARRFARLHRRLCRTYRLHVGLVFSNDKGSSGGSSYSPITRTIFLRGRLSLVTYLHEFAHARGYDERQACAWSIALFARCFPRSFARCRQLGHMLVAP
jgi:hypothetical protein